jgi:iron complex transport system substrate-binding protein
MKRTLSLVIALAAGLIAAAQASAAPAIASADSPLSFKDERGATITLPAKASRIVSLSPELTEILYAASAGDRVVGNTTYCNFPAAALSVTKVGGFSANTISLEAIVALRPDLIIGSLSAHGQLAAQFERAGLRFAALPTKNFDSVYSTLELAGRIAGDEAAANAVVTSMKARIAAIQAKTASVPADKHPIVFWETWDEPLMSAGPNTFTGQIIEVAGGRNCFADSTADWPVVSFEAVLARNPDYIMAADSHGEAMTPERLARRTGWASLKAVQTKRVVFLDGDIVSRAGPRFVEAAEPMAQVLYPELFR